MRLSWPCVIAVLPAPWWILMWHAGKHTRTRSKDTHTHTHVTARAQTDQLGTAKRSSSFSRNHRACYSSSGSAHQSEPTEVKALRGGSSVSKPSVTTKTKDCSGLTLHTNTRNIQTTLMTLIYPIMLCVFMEMVLLWRLLLVTTSY